MIHLALMDVGEKVHITAKSLVKSTVHLNVLKDAASDQNQESAVTCFVLEAALDQPKKIVWLAETFMMMENANKNVQPCKFTIPRITFGNQIRTVNMHMVLLASGIVQNIC